MNNGKKLPDFATMVKNFFDYIDDIMEPLSLVNLLLEPIPSVLYQYNFAIFKNDNYKKILVSFPGLTNYLQILDEIFHSGLIEIDLESQKEYFRCFRNVL